MFVLFFYIKKKMFLDGGCVRTLFEYKKKTDKGK